MCVIILGGSIVAYKLDSDGKIGKKLFYKKFEENSKIHQAYFSKDYSELYVINIGLSKLIKYDVIYDKEELKLINKCTFQFEKDTKPRHMVIDEKGNIYVITEETCELYKLICNNNNFEIVQKVSIVDKQKDTTGCAIKIDLQLKKIYTSIRGLNRIVVFNIEDDKLEKIQDVDCGGECPRDIVLDQKNKHLLCANQKSNNISVFEMKDGRITLKENKYNINSPTCIVVG